MSAARFRIEPLGAGDRTAFDCGVVALNEYFKSRATQDVRRRVSSCYVAIEQATERFAGYYTLAAAGIPLVDLPPELTRKLPRYPTIPAVRVGRLAVDVGFQGCGLGGALLIDGIDRICGSGIAAFAIVVDAKDERAAAFYRHLGFQPFGDLQTALFLPLSDALKRLVQ